MDAKIIGGFIAQKRKEANLSQKDLSERLHITDISLLIPLADILKVSLYDLLTGGITDE